MEPLSLITVSQITANDKYTVILVKLQFGAWEKFLQPAMISLHIQHYSYRLL